jgi:hypothetical protein
MDQALIRCGFNADTANYLISQGFRTPDDLLLASEDDFDIIARNVARLPPVDGRQLTMTFIAVKNLKGFRFWADEFERTGFNANPELFTDVEVSKYTKRCADFKIQKEAYRDEDPYKPDALKKLSTWALWNESFQNYLQQILSAAKIPLAYILREIEEPDAELTEAQFGTPEQYLAAATVFRGSHYDMDNQRLYRELKSFVVNGEGWTYIKSCERSQDGRKAYLALKLQCEGTASKITRKNKAYALIANAQYSGVRKSFKFQDYINIHQTAHNEVNDCDPQESIPESKKVSDFLKGITDPKLESAVSVVLGNPALLTDFQACQQYLATTVENRATLDKSKERNISGLSTAKGGKDKDKKKSGGKLPKNFKLENKFYPPHVYRLLSDEQKNQLKEWSKSSKRHKRTVSVLKQAVEELKKVEKDEKREKDDGHHSDSGDSSAEDAAGTAFGRGSHSKTKSKKAKT